MLENGEYYRVGETRPRRSSARIIAATNRDLREQVRTGRFREDLYHRLGVLTIRVPPLRERGGDALELLDHFRQLYSGSLAPFSMDEEARRRLALYPFPGNVRELRNIVIRLTAKHPGATVDASELALELDLPEEQAAELATSIAAEPSQADMALRRLQEPKPFSLDSALAEMERSFIDAALSLTQGNVSQAAKMLGINRTTLYSRMETTHSNSATSANSREP